MGLKVIQQSTGYVREARIVDDFKVQVRHLTRMELEKLQTACEGKDPEDQAALAVAAYLVDWSGCTLAALARIGVCVDPTQPVDANGCIPFDRDVARDVWRHALQSRFQTPIMATSLSILSAIEAEKELSKNGSGGWSLPSTTL